MVSLFCHTPVVGVKLGGDAAAHPVFCLSKLSLPCHVYALLAHTPLAALEPSTTTRLQAGVHLHSRLGPAVNCVLGYCGRNPKRSFVVVNYITGAAKGIFGLSKKRYIPLDNLGWI